MQYTHMMEYDNLKKEENPAIYKTMNEPWRHKQNKPGTGETLHVSTNDTLSSIQIS